LAPGVKRDTWAPGVNRDFCPYSCSPLYRHDFYPLLFYVTYMLQYMFTLSTIQYLCCCAGRRKSIVCFTVRLQVSKPTTPLRLPPSLLPLSPSF
jgi:hypothetical protein